ncbi:hypothetical protein KCTCHS21_32210 [Cohnella abietis]|uniref:Transposase IS801/IS1294 domain-containing protein n=1 Tax=Cohnella abietis TaxID=2507935 RepID=A0A3T1D6W9_9BACL|nr:transposase [Cohnella abietis]BBI33822.1 hypothetical protein KCTCHS21_32210 [Cohnella abietis]
MFQVNHRPMIFTIEEGLREVFLKNREMQKEHFEKKHKVIQGVIAGLHTFGSWEQVVFRYHDKTDDRDKEEQLTVEEFISRLIRHIPDEQLKKCQ